MPGDSRRINAPENLISPHIYQTAKKSSVLVDEQGKRHDGRVPDEMRPSILKLGIQTEASGSAYFECGNTKILCSVYGPRDVIRKSEFSHKGQILVDFKYAPYSCIIRQSYVPSSEEKNIAASLQQALESVVLMHKFPKSRVDIFIFVIENDGCVLSAALTCAGAALANAGIEMYDLVVGCTLKQYGTHSLFDPDAHEEMVCSEDSVNHGKIIMGMMPTYNQVILLTQDGEFEVAVLSKTVKMLIEKCRDLLSMVAYCVYQSVDKKNVQNDSQRNNAQQKEPSDTQT